jgi:hypothetical protein
MMVQFDVSQLPVSRQLSVALVVSYPVSQTMKALEPYVVVVNVKFPFPKFNEEPQSNYIIQGKHYYMMKIVIKSSLKSIQWFNLLFLTFKIALGCSFVLYSSLVHLILYNIVRLTIYSNIVNRCLYLEIFVLNACLQINYFGIKLCTNNSTS